MFHCVWSDQSVCILLHSQKNLGLHSTGQLKSNEKSDDIPANNVVLPLPWRGGGWIGSRSNQVEAAPPGLAGNPIFANTTATAVGTEIKRISPNHFPVNCSLTLNHCAAVSGLENTEHNKETLVRVQGEIKDLQKKIADWVQPILMSEVLDKMRDPALGFVTPGPGGQPVSTWKQIGSTLAAAPTFHNIYCCYIGLYKGYRSNKCMDRLEKMFMEQHGYVYDPPKNPDTTGCIAKCIKRKYSNMREAVKLPWRKESGLTIKTQNDAKDRNKNDREVNFDTRGIEAFYIIDELANEDLGEHRQYAWEVSSLTCDVE